MRRKPATGLFVVVLAIAWSLGPSAALSQPGAEQVAEINPFTRGVDVAPNGAVTVAETQFDPATFEPIGSTFLRFRPGTWEVSTIGAMDELVIDIANQAAGRGSMFALGASPLVGGSGDVFKWNPGNPRVLANVADWRAAHPDPFDLEGFAEDTNQWAIAPVGDGSVLVADAGGNEVLRIHTDGTVHSVARFTPVPSGAGEGFPPVSEAVPTSVAVGPDGAWYVGQLVGFPGLPGTARVYRIEEGTTGATCHAENPAGSPCTVFADGFTSIMDIDFGPDGSLYVLELSKMGWFALEVLHTPGSEVGALWKVRDGARVELAAGQVIVPGGMAAGPDGYVYVTTNFLGTAGPAGHLLRIGG